jgi:hypothetical protein
MRRRHSLNMGVDIRAISANKARGYPHGFRSMSHSTWGACCHCSRSRTLITEQISRPGNNTGERVATREHRGRVFLRPYYASSRGVLSMWRPIATHSSRRERVSRFIGEGVEVGASVVLILMWLVMRRRRSSRAVKTARSLTRLFIRVLRTSGSVPKTTTSRMHAPTSRHDAHHATFRS